MNFILTMQNSYGIIWLQQRTNTTKKWDGKNENNRNWRCTWLL